MTHTWTLYGSGRHEHADWALLHEHTRDWPAAWTDTGGFHLEPMPATPPATTHLWAFTRHRWLRVRLDVPYWWAAVLTLDVEFPLPWTRNDKKIEPTVAWIRHWEPNDDRVKQYRGTANVLGRREHVRLLPHLPLCAPFVGHKDDLPSELLPDPVVTPMPDDEVEDAATGG
ncbi:hypothetical protein [Saccharomonospora sp. NB11]|jgi:hypothetical protein|uniref:hypothetical protein n=1 Tax=Saccharomonospora sp. NB11 TaxID=1642298 RepID=UPI0018CFF718|nr:hypothetical protein [Saccharomonospora sp. NB11]